MAQTSYSITLSAAYEGYVADSESSRVIPLRNSIGSTQPYGRAVCFSTTEGDFRACAATRVLAGILVRANDHELDASGLPASEVGNILVEGSAWVVVEEAVVPGNPVRVRLTAGSGETVGAFRTGADSTDCALIPNAVYETAASTSGLARVRINLPGTSATMSLTADA